MKTVFAVTKKSPLIPTLYLSGLSYRLTEESLNKFLGKFGKITYLYILRDKKTKKSKGVAFAQFSKREEFERALSVLDGKQYMGRTLKASKAVENESMPFSTPQSRKMLKENPPAKKKKLKKGLDLLRG